MPRLAVGVYATSASTPLFFAQAIGRYVRSRTPGETASIFLPSVPTLLELASLLEEQRNHVLGKPHREPMGDEEPVERKRTEPGEEEKGFESLSASAELDQVIFDGASFGTATPAGSEEEAEYLGIPGLLDPNQMRDLLRRRQEEQLTKRTASGGASRNHLDARPVARATARAQRTGISHPFQIGEAARLDSQRVATAVWRTTRRRGHTRSAQGAHRGRPTLHREL